ncbi:MAG: nadC [Rhodospirillales bacterium]|nr:nadC [Rhodospirillales bacterium]
MLPQYLVREAVERALAEDIGRGDITTDALIDADVTASARLMAREAGIVAGLDLAEAAFRSVDSAVVFKRSFDDGQIVEAGNVIARISGSARALLSAERVALNFITHLSGIATLTGLYVAAITGSKARIVDTRKTLPGLRVFEKYAVRMGGGANHRFALDDAAMIKDNHIAAAGGIGQAITQVRAAIGHMVKICCEVDRIDQIEEALAAGVDVLLLDNMSPATLAQAVRLIAGRTIAEASGKVSLDTVAAIAASGVNVISVGKLTHSAPALDIALDFDG